MMIFLSESALQSTQGGGSGLDAVMYGMVW